MKKKLLSLNIYGTFHELNLFFPTRTIYFGGISPWGEDDVITSKSVAEVIKNLHILEYDKIAPITLLLNTIGGSWDDGIIIYDLIQSLKSPVTIIGMGKVYSMGSILIQAGSKRVLTKNTTMLIHDGIDGFFGDTKSFEKWAEIAKKVRTTMYEIYYERMKEKNNKITLANIEQLCSHDSVFNAQEAIDLGLADEIMEKVTKDA
jgi:ATP-dependent Clp protease protease subunit